MFTDIYIQFVLFFGVLGNAYVSSQDIVGCGGFVQSSVPIKFEMVEVRLYTKQGSFKLKTECAPNNGYFLAAVYDKGEYILQINPPAGWGFVPQQISLKIDGVNDPCSKGEDLNFVFTGFSVFGMIGSLRREQGPSNVAVKLLEADGKEVASNLTNEVGSFVLRNVMPGQYIVKAHHSTWIFKKDQIPVTVINDNTEIAERIEVAGYDVKGHVLSNGEPIQDVSFILYSNDVSRKHMVKSCNESISEEIISAITIADPLQALCIAISQKDGSFLFPTVPSGDYMLVPYYSAQSIIFDIVPSSLSFKVNYRSVVLKTPFQVYGFSVQGKIVDSKGNGINDAIVKAVAESGEERLANSGDDGSFLMVNVTTGHYIFQVIKSHYYFGKENIHITPNTPNLQSIVAKEYSLCGNIHSPLIPNGVLQIHQHKVLLQPEGEQNVKIKTTSPNKDGDFCFQVQPGKYKVEVPISESERKAGFLLKPSDRHVEVVSSPILDLKFVQFIGAVFGNVSCMEDCTDISVYMSPIDQPSSEKMFAKVEVLQSSAAFSFSNVLPGKYKVMAQRKKWCWEPSSSEIEVTDGDVSGIAFTHSGYYLKCTISHNITLNFTLENSEEVVGSFELKKGSNQFCLKTPGVYSLTPRSCYRFEKDTYSYNTAMPKSLELNVQLYKLLIQLHCSKEVGDLKLAIRSLSTNKEEKITAKIAVDRNSSEVIYEALFWGRLNEGFSVTPQSKEILFYPDNANVTVHENCPGASIQFDGREGKFIEGSIIPPLASVSVTIVTKPSEKHARKRIVILTDEEGKYRVGPLHTDIDFVITAAKEGYVIKPHDNTPGNFIAQKLGHITVMVTDQNDAPMSQVLLSLSGGQYRNNNLTDSDGFLMFTNLGPGQYFLRPMQKEYSFEPNSKMINVSEGEEVTVAVKGKRVAFSCSGVLLSLSGISEEGVSIEAVGLHKCSEYHEGAVSDQNGFYKLRGLQPGCAYNIRMIKSDNSPIERLAPTNQVINVQTEDIGGIDFIVFHKPTKFYITAHIDTELEYLSTLKMILYEGNDMDSPVLTISPGAVRYVQFPPLKPKTYVIKLHSSLSPKTHETRSISATVSPDRDLKKKHVKLKFEAKAKKIDMEPTQSVIALPLAVALVFLAYNYDAVLLFILKMNAFIHNFNKSGEASETDSDPDEELNRQSKRKRR